MEFRPVWWNDKQGGGAGGGGDGGGGGADRSDPNAFGGNPDSMSYGRIVPVVFGTAVVDLFLAYGPLTPRNGTGPEFKEDAAGVVQRTTGAVVSVAPAEYIAAQGPIASWLGIWRGDSYFLPGATWAAPGPASTNDLTGYTGATANPADLTLGAAGSVAAWAYAAALAVEHRVPFGHYAALRAPGAAITAIGGSLVCPDKRFPTDLRALLKGMRATLLNASTGYYGAPPSDVIRDIVEHTLYGMGLDAGMVVTATGSDGSAAASFDRYMTARGWMIARAWSERGGADAAIEEVIRACDSDVYWTGTNLRVVPLCADAFTGNAVTFTPPASAVPFTDDDIILESPQSDPVECSRRPESDIVTVAPVEFRPLYAGDFSTTTVEAMDSARTLWGSLGVRRAESLKLPCIGVGQHARDISQIEAQRSIYDRTTFRWRSSWRFIGVEPGDFVTLTHSAMGLSGVAAMVQSVEETDDGISFEAVEWFPGTSLVATALPQTADGLATNPLVGVDVGGIAGTIAAIGSDSVFSAGEIPAALTAWNDLSQTGTAIASLDLTTKAATAGQSSTAFTNAITALGTYLNAGSAWTTGTPSWLTGGVDVAITPATWQSTWTAAYTERALLVNAIANASVVSIADMANDGIISSVEKPTLWRELQRMRGLYNEVGSDPAAAALGTTRRAELYAPLYDLFWYATGTLNIDTLWFNPPSANPTLKAIQDAEIASWIATPITVDPIPFKDAFRAAAIAYETFRIEVAAAPAQRALLAPTGTPSSTTFLRGDGQWTTPGGGGTVTGVTGSGGVVVTPSSPNPAVSLTYGTAVNTVCQGNDARLADARVASDVSAWAKAATKPSYTAAEVGALASGGNAASATTAAACTGNSATVTHNATRTDGTAYPVVWMSGTASPAYSCAAVTITSSTGVLRATDFTATSDRRTKKKIATIKDALDKVLALRGVSFFRRNGNGKREIGLIAQEVQAVVPEVVHADDKGLLSISYGLLVGLLIEAIKILAKRQSKLEKRIARLEGR